MRRRLGPLLVGLALLAPAPALAAPALPLGHAGRWITDARGRVVILHGINMVYKLPPYYPAAIGFDADDAAFLPTIGFNVVRVGIIWKAVEPRPGIYDDAYIHQIALTVRTLARHRVLALLDFHQDQLNERFEGEGFPDWAIQDGGLPNPKLGFGNDYLGNPALEHALDAFWDDAPGPGGVGLQERYARAWAHVAAAFRGNPAVVGYEELNEPFPGTAWEPCANPAGCAAFDAKLTAFSRKVDRAIRQADPRALVWYEPNVIFNNGADTQMGAIGDPRAGFAFHDYCLQEPQAGSPAGCDTFDDLVFQHAVTRVAQTHDALMETEWGATDDLAYLDAMMARADEFRVPWIEWAYCGCRDPTTTGPGDKQAIVLDPRRPPRGSNLKLSTLRALVEPYPQVVAGTPLSWHFDAASRSFDFSYSVLGPGARRRFRAGSITEVAVPALVYGGRYAVRVTGARVVSRPAGGPLRLASCPGARNVHVTLTPGRATRNGCRARRRRSPRRHHRARSRR